MTIEEIKSQIEVINKGIDEKIETASKKWADATREEQKKTVDELKVDFVKHSDIVKKLQEHADKLDMRIQKQGSGERKHKVVELADFLKSDDAFNKFKSGQVDKMTSEGLAKMLSYKVDDMTQALALSDVNTVIPPHNVPGIFYDPDTMFRVRNLMPVGTTTSNLVRVVYESAETLSTYTDITAEGSEYKQGDFDLSVRDAVVYKITNYIIVSEEMLEDVDGLASYIYARMPSKIAVKENQQLLYGTGSSQISGLSTNATAYSDNLADSTVTLIDVLADAKRQLVDDEYTPTEILLHPADATKYLKLEKDSQGRYIYPWIFTNQPMTIDGVRVVETTAVTQGHFFVGDFRRAAQVFDRRQNTVEMVNTNEDNFIKGMITVRAAERIALAIYRPTAFLYGSIANAVAVGSA